MANETLDRVSPAFVGEDRISIEIDEGSFLAGNLFVLRPITLQFDYSDADPDGVILPIEIVIQPKFGDGTGYIRQVFSRVVPKNFTFKATGAGAYLILIRELFHNQWQGRKVIQVEGDPFSDVQVTTRTV